MAGINTVTLDILDAAIPDEFHSRPITIDTAAFLSGLS
jgi:hypothetical protein